jgi:hypothetical protein
MATRKEEQLAEVKDAVDIFIIQLYEKNVIGFVEEADEMRPMLEDFLFSQLETARDELLARVRERIGGQLDEEER